MNEYRAHAKINLALHVTGRRNDGYHYLDTLVAFAEYGDVLRFEPADGLSLNISGRFSSALDNNNDNLVLKAARMLQRAAFDKGYTASGAAIHLEKNLPIASGIGGGSADAAATLLVLCDLWAIDTDTIDLARIGLALGADVPMCLQSSPLRAAGIGEELEEVFLPSMNIVLVNPGAEVSTPRIFGSLTKTNSTPLPPLGREISDSELLLWLKNTQNDLQLPAISHATEIQTVLNALLARENCSFARMSGSGATCFGIFPSAKSANDAATDLSQRFSSWWCIASKTIATDQKM